MTATRGRKWFIAYSTRSLTTKRSRETLPERLIAGYQANAAVDLAISSEWQILDEETWLKYIPAYEGEEPAHDAADTT